MNPSKSGDEQFSLKEYVDRTKEGQSVIFASPWRTSPSCLLPRFQPGQDGSRVWLHIQGFSEKRSRQGPPKWWLWGRCRLGYWVVGAPCAVRLFVRTTRGPVGMILLFCRSESTPKAGWKGGRSEVFFKIGPWGWRGARQTLTIFKESSCIVIKLNREFNRTCLVKSHPVFNESPLMSTGHLIQILDVAQDNYWNVEVRFVGRLQKIHFVKRDTSKRRYVVREGIDKNSNDARPNNKWLHAWTRSGQAVQRRGKQERAIEKPQFEYATNLKCVVSIDPSDEEYKDIITIARRQL